MAFSASLTAKESDMAIASTISHSLQSQSFATPIVAAMSLSSLKFVRICHAYWRGNEVATVLESLTPLRREG